ncbi:DUF1127 domain-containing protein [Shimia biformata]|uniref:DUF1127 domain-containing protein n=1 Tax=Shimia biformata TaxID=1294299 RepID=UPI001951A102|nr:DUF1127 domain-containing protein [Shimia biformata]
MALTDTHATTEVVESFSIKSALAAPFVAVGNFLVKLAEANSRVQKVERLNAMSDDELKKIGLRREDIVRHVFRDYMVF